MCTQRFSSPGATERAALLFIRRLYGWRKFYCTIFFSFFILQCFLFFLPLSLTHTPFPLLSMEWCMCIVSVVAEGPCLCSASLYSFVKCGFGRRLVGRVQGGRWQQQASLFLSPSLLLPLLSPLLHWPLAVSVGSVLCVAHFFLCMTCASWLPLTWQGEAGIDQADKRRIALASSFTGPCCTLLGIHIKLGRD